THVEHDAALAKRLPAHAVAHAGGGDGQLVVARKGKGPGNILDAAYLDHAVDLGLVEAARIIDAAAKLRPFHVLERRNRLDPLQIDFRLLAAANRRPAILFPGGIGRQRLKLAIAVEAEQHDDHGGNGHAGFEFLGKFLHELIPEDDEIFRAGG